MAKKNTSIKITLISLLILAAISIILIFTKPASKYSIDKHIPGKFQDTLMTNIVTYMGVKPKYADWQTRHDSIHRTFYTEQAKAYRFFKYFIDKDGNHFFYIIRPVRTPLEGHKRAIAGRLKADESMNLVEYEELFVTRILEETKLEEIAEELFIALINSESDKYLADRSVIEWPDDRLLYDKIKKEWRYDVK